MNGYFAVLEDNADRIDQMRSCVTRILPSLRLVFFANAFGMIDWLRENLSDVSLISLDHDLPILDGDHSIDCGDGRMVADFLVVHPPTCPVIVHSSNSDCAAGMYFALARAGWPVARIIPFDDLAWVETSWKQELLRLVESARIQP